MRHLITYIKLGFLSLMCLPAGCSQDTPAERQIPGGIHLQNPRFDHQLSRMLTFHIPVISVDSFKKNKSNFFILDTRTTEEYKVSHIENAHFMNYDRPDYTMLDHIPFDTPIVIYCSVGYRSEKLGEPLQKLGFTQVFNLYGGIFEWVNEGHQVINPVGRPTDTLHTYNKRWSKYVDNTGITKTW